MFLLIIEKNKASVLRDRIESGFELEFVSSTSSAEYYIIVPSTCKDEEGWYIHTCVITEFEKRLEKVVDLMLNYVKELSPIAIIATPLPFKYPFLFNVFPYVEPYAAWFSGDPKHSLKVRRFLGLLIASTSKCYRLFAYPLFHVVAYDIFIKTEPATDYTRLIERSELFSDCFSAFREKMNITRYCGGVLMYQKNAENYRVYVGGLSKKLEELCALSGTIGT